MILEPNLLLPKQNNIEPLLLIIFKIQNTKHYNHAIR